MAVSVPPAYVRDAPLDEANVTLCNTFVPLVATSREAVNADAVTVLNEGDAPMERSCAADAKPRVIPFADASVVDCSCFVALDETSELAVRLDRVRTPVIV